MTAPAEMRIATLNVRNTADRWRRRRPLIARQLVELDPHVIGLQELRTLPNQCARISRDASRRAEQRLVYEACRAFKTGLWGLWEGIGTLTRLPVVDCESLKLQGQRRVAQRVTVRLPGGELFEVYNAHLASKDEALRTRQAALILEWMRPRAQLPQVLLGDFNARPGSPTIDLITATMRSAYATVHGREPSKTVPTPLRRGATGPGSVVDYIFLGEQVDVHDARVVFDEADPADEHLVASDHYGLAGVVSIRPVPPGK